MKKLIILFTALLITTIGLSQSKEELLLKLKNENRDSVKINLLNELAKEALTNGTPDGKKYAIKAKLLSEKINYVKGLAGSYSNLGRCMLGESKYDSAFYYFNKGISITVDKNFKSIHAELLNRKGVAFFYTGNTDSSLFYLKNSYKQFEELQDSNEVVKLLNNIGAISLRKGDIDGALTYFYKCLRYDEKQKNEKGIASDCDNIAVILINKRDYTSSYTYSQRALKIKIYLQDTAGICKTYLNMGNNYLAKTEYKAGIKEFLTGLSLAEKTRNEVACAEFMNNLGICYLNLNEFATAMNYLTESLKIKNKLGIKNGVAATLGNIADIYFRQKMYAKAITYNIESDKLAQETGDIHIQKNTQKSLAEAYMYLNQTDKAVTALNKSMLLQDSIYNETSSKQVAEVQIKYESEKKENENRLLQQQNAIKSLEIENNTEKIKIKNQTIFLLIGAILIAVVLVFWQISLARIKKQKRELETEKKLQLDRERISRDLHDNVGGQLSYVLFSLEAKEDISAEKRKEKAINLAGALRSVTGNLRETIWALNKEKLSLKDLSDKLKIYTRNIFSYTDIKIKFEEHIEQDTELNPAFALNLFRICQEIINNAFKHAQASELIISISRNENIKIVIADNGVGFSETELKQSGFGMDNLKNRAKEINASLNIISKPANGTSISLIV
ncbi:MAG: sensor histidine kinase [Bacteroidia bacterium]